MKRLIAISVFIIAAITFSTIAYAADSGGQGDTGSILDFVGVSSGGCGASGFDTPCSEDATKGFFAAIACKVMKSFNTGVIPLYCNIVSNAEYLAAINAAMMLYVVLLGLSFIFGLIPMRAGVVVGKVIKAVIIYSLIINADMFFGLVYNTVIQTTQDAVRILLNAPIPTAAGLGVAGAASAGASSCSHGSNDFFQYVDCAMHNIFSTTSQADASTTSGQTYNKTHLKIFMMAVAIWQLGGDLIGGIFFAVVVGWIVAYFSIMIRYLLAMLSMMFLLMLGPLFIPTMLFEQSKYMGEEWIFMLITFMAQIILVIAFVLMVQGFFTQFYDLIAKGVEGTATMTQSKDKMVVPFNTDENENNGAYRVTDRSNSMGYTPAEAERYFTEVFGGDYKEKLPDMVFKLIEMMIVVYFATAFLAVVPSLAALLVGKAKFIRIFAGESFGPRDKLTQANLLGQKASKEKFELNSIIQSNANSAP